jgi:hypothetical protein
MTDLQSIADSFDTAATPHRGDSLDQGMRRN